MRIFLSFSFTFSFILLQVYKIEKGQKKISMTEKFQSYKANKVDVWKQNTPNTGCPLILTDR